MLATIEIMTTATEAATQQMRTFAEMMDLLDMPVLEPPSPFEIEEDVLNDHVINDNLDAWRDDQW